MQPLVIFGIGSPIAIDFEETCRRLGIDIAAAIKNMDGPSHVSSDVPVVDSASIPGHLLNLGVVLPMFTPAHRKTASEESSRLGFSRRGTLIDPTSAVAKSATFGSGVFVNAGCTIGGAASLHDFVFINRGASIAHHCVIEAFASLGPAAVLAGAVRIGRGAVVGAGAVILPGIEIGANAVVGAGAVVTRSVLPACVVVGNPARVVSESNAGYNGLSVSTA
ncbi:MAG: acetyltransferase [Proteobacteria bacterium]|nr:acetyltransferase [Burkholderiales bacterium]